MRAQFIFSEVFNGFRRNLTMTVAMIITTAITLGMFGGGLLVIQMADKSQKIFLDRVEMQFFLNEDVSKADANCRNAPCTTLRADLEKQPGVGSVTYVSPEEAISRPRRCSRRPRRRSPIRSPRTPSRRRRSRSGCRIRIVSTTSTTPSRAARTSASRAPGST